MSLLVIFTTWIGLAVFVIYRTKLESRKLRLKKDGTKNENVIELTALRECKRTELLESLLHEKLVQENSLDDSNVSHGFQKIQWRRKVRKQLGIVE